MEQDVRQQTLESYLKLFDDLKTRTGDERTAIAILQEVNKDVRMAQIRAERNGGSGTADSQPASIRQKNYLKKLGVEIPIGLTKQEASALIDEALEKESEEDSPQVRQENFRIPWYSVSTDRVPSWDHYVLPIKVKGDAEIRRWI